MRDAAAAPLLAPLPAAERYVAWHLVHPDGTVVGRGAGGLDVLAAVPRTRRVGRALGVLPARVLDAVYGLVARNRALLGRVVPDGPAPRRFP